MRKLIIGAVLALSLSICGVAVAQPAAHAHTATYTRLYQKVSAKFGARTPGRNIVRWGVHGHSASDGDVVKSIAVLRRMLAPPPKVVYAAPVASTPTQSSSVSYTTSAPAVSAAPSSGLAACIISRESGGNAQAVNPNGHYGIAQWSDSTWLAQGGGKYSSTPLGASAAQQEQILNSALANGGASNWTPYDGC